MKSFIDEKEKFYNVIREDELVYIFGTGISSALTDKPYGWGQWIMDGIEHISDNTKRESLKKQLKSDWSTDNMIKIVGEVLLVTKKEGTYEKWMRDSFETNHVTNMGLAETLGKLFIFQANGSKPPSFRR